jgi:uncharacterized protein involved in exopolysaccharide biosynthesis
MDWKGTKKMNTTTKEYVERLLTNDFKAKKAALLEGAVNQDARIAELAEEYRAAWMAGKDFRSAGAETPDAEGERAGDGETPGAGDAGAKQP